MKLLVLLSVASFALSDSPNHQGHGGHHHTEHQAAHHSAGHHPVNHSPIQHRVPQPQPHHAVAHVPIGQRQPVRRFPQRITQTFRARPAVPRPQRLIRNKPRPVRSHLPITPVRRPGAPGRVPARPPISAQLLSANPNSLSSKPVGPSKTNPKPTSKPAGDKSLKVLLEENEHFSTLLAALKAAELLDTLAGKGPFTLFAPTNSAFDKVDINDLNALMANKEKLKETLLRHLVPGINIDGTDIPDGNTNLRTAGGEQLIFNRGKFVQVSSSNNKGFVVKFDFPASNGVYHAVDQVL